MVKYGFIVKGSFMRKKIIMLLVICVFVGLIIALVKFNKWIQGEVGGIVENPISTSTIKPLPPPVKKKVQKRTGEVIRKTRLAPERTFEVSVFYQ